jgi:eukaryotic-like serine/threonine-protein kinase
MNNERWQRIKQLFAALAMVPPAERTARLDAECADDADSRALVESLLAQHDAAGDAVRGAVERAAAEAMQSESAASIGRKLGPWQLVGLIARGGMGAVYLAERADGQFEQAAAVKLINPATLSAEALQRFNDERQILARLRHPNVARLIDGGTTEDGVPWLAMELVEGARIDEYCRRERLDLDARLTLFRKVCAAVQYAHRNLVVHRDIKPSNILVDRDGEPKLLDFGVAKLFRGEQRELTVTVTERRALTPRYASPEQLRGLPLTTSTDIYSLAVLLYELLVGGNPYGVDGADSAKLYWAICEAEPVPPSAIAGRAGDLTGTLLGAERLRRALRGDLDNIVLKALRKEPERRYDSVQDFSDDVERYLHDEPVTARADTFQYRAAKFVKRRRGPVLAAAAVAVAVAVQSAFFVQRILTERDVAEAARSRAEQMSQFLQDMLRGADRFESSGQEVTVRDVLDSGAERVRTQLADEPVEQARMMQTIADTYHALSMYEPAMALTKDALSIRRRELGPDDVETLQSMREEGVLTYLGGGDTNEAVKLLEETRDRQIAALGSDSSEVAATRNELGIALRTLGSPSAALAELRTAYDVLVKLPPEHPDHRFEPSIMNQIGNALDAMGESENALGAYREALALYTKRGQEDDPVVGGLQHNIGLTLRTQGKLKEALPYLRAALDHTRRILGEQSEDFEVQLTSLGRTLAQLGRFDEANPYLNRAVEVGEQLYGVEHPYFAYDLVNQARLLQLEGRHAEAVAIFERATAIYRKAYGPYHRFLAAAEVGLADSLIELSRAAEAEALVRGTLERMHADPEHERQVEAMGRNVRGKALAALGRDAEARALLSAGVGDLREIVGNVHPLTAQAAGNLVTFLDARGEKAAADEYRGLLAASGQ